MAISASWATRMVIDALRGKNTKVALMDGFTQEDAQSVWADVQSFEVAGSGYTPGGLAAPLDVWFNAENRSVDILCPSIPFGLLGVASIDAAVFYDDTGNPLTSRILAADTFAGGGLGVAGNEFTYVPGEALLSLSIESEL